MNDDQESQPLSFDARTRRLCPDGACVGLLGQDGRCPVCGAEDAANPIPGLGADSFAGGCATEEPIKEEAVKVDGFGGDGAVVIGGFDARRKLCSDGSCLGVIGTHGRCEICDRSGAD